MKNCPWVLLAAAALFAQMGCQTTTDCGTSPPEGASVRHTCRLPTVTDQPFDVVLPEQLENAPVIFLLHGGGGNRNIAHRVTCPEGDASSSRCFAFEAARRGYVTVIPTGSPTTVNYVWAAGGGVDGYRCTGGSTCEDGIDHVPYLEAILDDLERWVSIDRSRVFSTGISNGGAMSYRFACDRAEAVAAVAVVGGVNPAEVAPGCSPAEPVAVLHLHGTDDPCAPFEGGPPTCPAGQPDLAHISVADTLTGNADQGFIGWVQKNQCEPTATVTSLPDAADDGTTTERHVWSGCANDVSVELLKTEGGGHTWPQGFQELPVSVVGIVAEDFSANEAILDFFDRY